MKLKRLLGDDNLTYSIADSNMNLQNRVEELSRLSCDMEAELHSVWADYHDARSLLDGCYEVVELFNPETPSQVEWKQNWLEGARKHGASGL